METTKCKALVAFTVFVPEFGMVHGDPDSSDQVARTPQVPDHLIEAWADEGKIEAAAGAKSGRGKIEAAAGAKSGRGKIEAAAGADEAPAA